MHEHGCGRCVSLGVGAVCVSMGMSRCRCRDVGSLWWEKRNEEESAFGGESVSETLSFSELTKRPRWVGF